MLDTLRLPFFLVAVVLLGAVWLVEIGSTALIDRFIEETETPGYGIATLPTLDALVLLTVVLMGVSLVFPERIHGRVQGIVTLLVSLAVIIWAIAAIFMSFAELMIMLALLMSPPFGTIAYMAIYSHFATGAAQVTLSLVMTLKLFFAGFLVFAHQRFLQNKGLVLIILTTLLTTLIIEFLHGLVPGFLVSITDAIGAIVVGIVALIWAIVFLVGGIIATVKAIV